MSTIHIGECQCLRVRFLNFSFLKPNIYARIIAPCAVDIVIKTLAVVFKREFFGFSHVRRLEHHAIAPVTGLPKQTGKTQTHYYSEDYPACGRMNEVI
jgi:hypothetical protein